MRRWFWVIFLFCLGVGMGWLLPVQAQSAPVVTFSSTETVNQFPTSLTFRTTVSIDQGEIAAAKLLLRNSNFINLASGTTVIDLDISPKNGVRLGKIQGFSLRNTFNHINQSNIPQFPKTCE